MNCSKSASPGAFFLTRSTLLLASLALGFPLKAQSLMSLEEAGRHIFGAKAVLEQRIFVPDLSQQKELEAELAQAIKGGWRPLWSKEYALYRVRLDGKFKAWLLIVEEIGKHKPITFAVGVSSLGIIEGLEVLEYRESYGVQIAKQGFLRQYIGKTLKDPIKTPGDIDAISGATYSSFATNRATRKALAVLKVSGWLEKHD